jgi:hypothetical protein
MSWIRDLKELFSRTELEQKSSEAALQAETSLRVASKLNDFREEYAKLAQNAEVKAMADKLLKKIEMI